MENVRAYQHRQPLERSHIATGAKAPAYDHPVAPRRAGCPSDGFCSWSQSDH
jgi:hypothetical protein